MSNVGSNQNWCRLKLYKSDFKFSAAHFLIFDHQTAEKLHGHNYQVRVEIGFPHIDSKGFNGDFGLYKATIRQQVASLDECVLLPESHPEVKCKEVGDSLEVRFRERFYVFPKNEVLLLPISNTSVEELSRILCESFVQHHRRDNWSFVEFEVEETRGQSGCYGIQNRSVE